MSRLPHTSPNLTSSIAHFPSKRPKFDEISYDQQWPGVPYMHSDPSNPGAGNINTEGETGSNGIVELTFISHWDDEEYITQSQMVWIDVREPHDIKLVNLAQLNLILAETQANPERYLKPSETFDIGYIHDNFRFGGIVAANSRGSGNSAFGMGRQPNRAHTLNVFGYTQCYDYWSHKASILQPYMTLYFVIKKIKVGPNHTYQTKVNASDYDRGSRIENLEGKYIYQVVPYATCNRYIKRKEYSYLNERGMEEIGSYWYIGRSYENNNIENISTLKLRGPYSTSRDTSRLYQDTATLTHLYLLRDRDPKIFC